MARLTRPGGSLVWRRAADVQVGEFVAVPAGTIPPAVLVGARVLRVEDGEEGAVMVELEGVGVRRLWRDDVLVLLVGMADDERA